MSEYPIRFKDGTWGWRHWSDEPDFEKMWEEHVEEELEKEQEKNK